MTSCWSSKWTSCNTRRISSTSPRCAFDRPPDFSGETSREADEQGRELFGDNWPRVRSLLAVLESYQIYYPQPYNSITPKPYNIVFPKDAEQAGPILP